MHGNQFYDLFDHFCVWTNLIEIVYLFNRNDSLWFKRFIHGPKCSANSSTFHECVVIGKHRIEYLIYLKLIISSVSKPSVVACDISISEICRYFVNVENMACT